ELGQPIHLQAWWIPSLIRALHQRSWGKIQHLRQLLQCAFVHLPSLRCGECVHRNASARGEVRVRQFQSALRLSQNIRKIVFQRNRSHAFPKLVREPTEGNKKSSTQTTPATQPPESGRGLPHSKTFGGSSARRSAK